jgi:IMP dehydrogenase
MATILQTITGADALTFDDVLLQPGHSDVMPGETDIRTTIARDIDLSLPIISSAMDTVTESRLAIAMAQAGGIGIIHRNLNPAAQAEEVRQVKKFESGMVVNPVTIGPDATLADALALMKAHRISGIPVVENAGLGSQKPGRLVGILTNRDVRFASDPGQKVYELMTREGLVTVRENVEQERGQAPAAPASHREAARRRRARLLRRPDHRQGHREVAAQSGCRQGRAGPAARRRAVSVGADAAGARRAPDRCRRRRHRHRHRARPFAARARFRRPREEDVELGAHHGRQRRHRARHQGADRCRRGRIKVGIGPGSICTTRIVAGVGVPQLAAVMAPPRRPTSTASRSSPMAASSFPAISPRRLPPAPRRRWSARCSPARTKARARSICTRAAPTRPIAAWAPSARWRAAPPTVTSRPRCATLKLVPEGIEGQVPYKGPVSGVLHQLAGGLRAAMGYTGAKRRCPEFELSGKRRPSCASPAPASAKATPMT